MTRRERIFEWLLDWLIYFCLWSAHATVNHRQPLITPMDDRHKTTYTYNCEYCRMRRHA